MSDLCPCGSQKVFSSCCEPLLRDGKATTAEQLMRSRYVAYTLSKMDYILSTHDEETRDELDMNIANEWASKSTWLGLEVVSTEAGGEKDDNGLVEFKARYRVDGKRQQHHELSEFVKREGEWFYHDGKAPKIAQIRNTDKIGRNDFCICGSGKKYKKCCGKAA